MGALSLFRHLRHCPRQARASRLLQRRSGEPRGEGRTSGPGVRDEVWHIGLHGKPRRRHEGWKPMLLYTCPVIHILIEGESERGRTGDCARTHIYAAGLRDLQLIPRAAWRFFSLSQRDFPRAKERRSYIHMNYLSPSAEHAIIPRRAPVYRSVLTPL